MTERAFLEIVIPGSEFPPERRHVIEEAIDAALAKGDVGEVTGGGTGESSCNIDVEADLGPTTIAELQSILRQHGAPLGTVIHVNDGSSRTRVSVYDVRSPDPSWQPLRPADRALFEAIRAGDASAVRAALLAGADANAHDPEPRSGCGNTPLHEASSKDLISVVHLLLEVGAQPNVRCSYGWTPLMRACNAGSVSCARALLDAGADPHLRNDEGYTAWGRIPGNCTELIQLFKDRQATNERIGAAES